LFEAADVMAFDADSIEVVKVIDTKLVIGPSGAEDDQDAMRDRDRPATDWVPNWRDCSG
jgi:hypothetical protein